jgi:prenyltransferase beta subunit
MSRLLISLVGIVITLPALAQAPTAEQKQATVAWVKSLQKENGGFAADAKSEPTLPATLAAVRVFKYFGGEVPNREACGKFVMSCFDKSTEGFASNPGGKPDVRTTALGLMAAIELKALTPDAAAGIASRYFAHKTETFEEIRLVAAALEALDMAKSPASRAGITFLATALELQCSGSSPKSNADSTYGEGGNLARDTAGVVVTLVRLQTAKKRYSSEKLDEANKLLEGAGLNGKNPLAPESKQAIVKALRAGQRPDGGWGKADAPSDFESTYRVLRAFWMLKAKPDIAACQAFIAKCRNADGSYSVLPGQPGTVNATYFAAIVSHWLAELK